MSLFNRARTALVSAPFWLLAPSLVGQIALPSPISDATFGPLLAGQTYLATGLTLVPSGATLTIQPGAVIKFDRVGFLQVAGTVIAVGDATNRIVFTSMHDDTVGAPLATRPPAPADWDRILDLNPTNSRFEFCDIRYAGRNAQASFFALGSDPALRDCTIRDGAGAGITLQSSLATIERCDIHDCAGPSISGVQLAGLPNLLDNTASGNGGGNTIRIGNGLAPTSMIIGPRNTTDSALVFTQPMNVRGAGTELEFLPGTVIKFDHGSLNSIQGSNVRLVAHGTPTQPVVFTSALDDSVAGDALGDGPTTGSPGDWNNLDFRGGTSCDFENVTLRFAGRNLNTMLFVGAFARLHDCVLEQSASAAFDFNGGVAANQPPDIRRCTIRDNAGRPFRSINWDTLPGLADNVASGNALGDHLVILPTSLRGDLRILAHQTLNNSGVVECLGVTTSFGRKVEFGPGMILKLRSGRFAAFSGSSMTMTGRGDAPIVITTITDDAFGGDTNGDGNATMPAPGDIQGIFFDPTALGGLSHVRVRFGGGTPMKGAVECSSNSVSITSTRVDRSVSRGFSVSGLSGLAANWVAWQNLGAGITVSNGGFDVQHATSTQNLGFGLEGINGYGGTIYSSVAWDNVDGTEPNNFVGVRSRCRACNGILVQGNLFADPLFVDPDNGDLHLHPTSINVGRGDLPQATLFGEDHDGNSRILDHADNGLALPDIGAYEVFRYRMDIQGEPRIGQTTELSIVGPGPTGAAAGAQLYLVGPAVGGQFLPPFGVLLTGTLATSIGVASGPIGSPLSLAVPDDPALIGGRFGIQALLVRSVAPFIGHLTNPLLATIES